MRFRFVHAADLHLDTPFEGLRRVEPFVADALRDASLQAFDALVRLALDRRAAFVVLAGDVYDGAERGVRAQLALRRGLEALSAAGVATFVVHGNHDPVEEGWSAVRAWPPLVTVFGTGAVAAVPVEHEGVPVATVHGVSYARRAVTENLALRFRRTDGPGFHVGVLHANVGGSADHAPYSPCTVDDLRRAELDYWALGHVHARQVVHAGDPWVVYPGNLQGRSPKPSERGPKGAVVVEVDGAVAAPPEFVALDRVRFETVEVDVGALSDLAEVHAALQGAAEVRFAEADGRSLLVRATLTGRGPACADLRREGALVGLLQGLRDEAGQGSPFLWWEAVRDGTRPALDVDAVRRRGDFAAELLAVADELGADDATRRAFAEERLSALPAAELRRLVAPGDPATAERWREAVELALDALAPGGAA